MLTGKNVKRYIIGYSFFINFWSEVNVFLVFIGSGLY